MPKEKTGIASIVDNIVKEGAEKTGFKQSEAPKRTNLSILEREAREVAGVESEDDSSEEGGDDSDDGIVHMADLFRRKMGGQTPFAGEETEEDDSVTEETDEKGQKTGKSQEEGQENEENEDSEGETQELDEELKKKVEDALSVDANKLSTKSGGPVNAQVTQVVKKLKATLKDVIEDNKRLRKEKAVPTDPELENNYKLIKEAHEELKKKWEERYFEETPEWKETYEKPIETAAKEASKWLGAHEFEEGSEEGRAIDAYKTIMHESLYNGDEVKFYKASDTIADLLPKGIANRFVAASVKLWDAHAAKREAFTNKDESRKAVINKTSSFINEASKEVNTGLDTMLSNWESMNKKIIDVYRENPKYRDIINYKETVSDAFDTVKKHVDHAIRNRKVSPELQEVIFNGVLSGLRNKEMEGLRALIKSQRESIEILEKKLGENDKALSKVRTKTKPRASGSSDGESDDTPKSMKELWEKRMKTS